MGHKRYILLVLITLLTVVGVLTACSTSSSPSTQVQSSAPPVANETFFRAVSPQEAKRIIDQNLGQPDFVVLDVRTPQEFQSGHIKGAINLDFYAPDFPQQLDKLDKTKTYVVYCRSGNRSGKTVQLMKRLGFQRVYDVQGGIKAWTARGLPLTR